MDLESRVRLVELHAQSNRDALKSHEDVCALRLSQLLEGQASIQRSIKYLGVAVVMLGLVVVGVATVHDVIRAGLRPLGIEITKGG